MGLLRLLLAFSVVLGHGGGYADIIFVNGNAAVYCFFIISGFYIALLLDTDYMGRPLEFYINRVLRLYPAYFCVLAITVAYREVTAGDISAFFGTDVEAKIWALVSNILFVGMDYLRFNAVSEFGYPANWRIIPQAWSLDVELMFYAIAPLFLVWPSSKHFVKFAVFFLLALLAWSISLNIEYKTFLLWFTLPKYLVFFASGAVSYALFFYIKTHFDLTAHHHFGIAFFLGLLIIITSYTANVYEDRELGAKNIALYFAIVIWLPFLFSATRFFNFDRHVGELSYPVYLVHLLVIEMMADYGLLGYKWKSTGAVVFFVVISAIAIRHFIESPVEQLRAKVRG